MSASKSKLEIDWQEFRSHMELPKSRLELLSASSQSRYDEPDEAEFHVPIKLNRPCGHHGPKIAIHIPRPEPNPILSEAKEIVRQAKVAGLITVSPKITVTQHVQPAPKTTRRRQTTVFGRPVKNWTEMKAKELGKSVHAIQQMIYRHQLAYPEER